MAPIRYTESLSIGLDNESLQALSSTEANSLLRILTFPIIDDRTYSSVSMLPMADGSSLYVRPY